MNEITPASLVRGFLIEAGLEPAMMLTRRDYRPYTCFHVATSCGDMVRISDCGTTQVSVEVGVTKKIKVGHTNRISGCFYRTRNYLGYQAPKGWMAHGDTAVFNIAIPGSLEHILEFLTPISVPVFKKCGGDREDESLAGQQAS